MKLKITEIEGTRDEIMEVLSNKPTEQAALEIQTTQTVTKTIEQRKEPEMETPNRAIVKRAETNVPKWTKIDWKEALKGTSATIFICEKIKEKLPNEKIVQLMYSYAIDKYPTAVPTVVMKRAKHLVWNIASKVKNNKIQMPSSLENGEAELVEMGMGGRL